MAGEDEKKKKDAESKPREYNPRWKGYLLIVLASLVSFASICNIPKSRVKGREWGTSVSFGAVSFTFALLVLIVDRSPCTKKWNLAKAYDGKAEGAMLVVFVLWWTVGVGYVTRVGGVAYQALNIYFSSWAALGSSVYTLDKWSSSKDIISIHELTRLSATLKWWWVLLCASIVTFAASADAQAQLSGDKKDDTSLGISFGCASMITSFIAILEHYNMRCCRFVKHGGCLEISVSLFLIVLWLVCCFVLTQDDGIAATIAGSNPGVDYYPRGANCTAIIQVTETDGGIVSVPIESCSFIPGSNLYLSTWTGLISSVTIAARWKAASAIKFAHAQDNKILSSAEMDGEEAEGDEEDFVDASEDAI